MFYHILLFFLLQVEVPPLVIGGTSMKKVMTTQSAVALGVEKEPLSGGMAEEVEQVVKDAWPILPFAPLVV